MQQFYSIRMNLYKLLVAHAVVTCEAGVVLIVSPQTIPGTINIHVDKSAYLLCYLLGASEILIAFLSFIIRKLTDSKALKFVSLTMIVFHGSTAVVEL